MTNQDVLNRFVRIYEDLFAHDGFGEIRVEMRLLKKGQKEVILHCGKQHRFVVDYGERQPLRWGVWKVVEAQPAAAGGERRSEGDRRRHQLPIGFEDRRRNGDRRQR
ncbi:hypothetical protein CKO44_24885 [Rubrivivax gelatinosus]|uniref:Uncharacterized protein n=1 Tax=Rubrivivax gelatinosus TaxID=28068 RepID=A0ABS1E0T4_RUBGE|nr:hypothetical protein [Rubrivivax gelatinosus]MBK1616680.1 hypothetical protein [Rubrivivax gelatinosus]MBK1715986.1 hypothetical protein [Rubrivivax gelatinosus]